MIMIYHWLFYAHCFCYYSHIHAYKTFTNKPPLCWQVTGLYTPGRGEITSLDAGNIDDILSEFLPSYYGYLCIWRRLFQSDSDCTCVVHVGVSYPMVLCHCSRSNDIKPHVSLHRQCRGGSSQLLCRLVSLSDKRLQMCVCQKGWWELLICFDIKYLKG